RWCRHSTAAIGGSIRFVADVLIVFEVAKHVPTRTQQHANLDRQQPQLHPAGIWAAGIRYPGRRVDLGLREAVTSRGLEKTEAATLAAGEALPRDRRASPDDPGPPWTAKGPEEGLSSSPNRLTYPCWPVIRRPSMAGELLSPRTVFSLVCSETRP